MIGVIAYLMLQSQYEADQRDSHHQDQQHEDIFRGSRQQNSGKLIFKKYFWIKDGLISEDIPNFHPIQKDMCEITILMLEKVRIEIANFFRIGPKGKCFGIRTPCFTTMDLKNPKKVQKSFCDTVKA